MGPTTSNYSTRAAARIVAVSPDRIRYWVRRSLLHPTFIHGRQMRFGFDELLVMRLAKELIPTRRHLEPIRRCFDRMRKMFGPARRVTSLKLANHDGRIVVRDGPAMLDAESGQLLFDFGAPRSSAKIDDRFGPARVRARFDEARALAESDPLRALMLYSDLLGREPRNFDAHMDIAGLLERKGDIDGAIRHLLGAAAILPANAAVHLRLGALYRRRGDQQSAAASFGRAAQCDPLSVEAHRNLAELYDAMGRQRDAIRHLSTVNRLSRTE